MPSGLRICATINGCCWASCACMYVCIYECIRHNLCKLLKYPPLHYREEAALDEAVMPADAFAQKQAMMHRLQEQQEAFKVRNSSDILLCVCIILWTPHSMR